VQERIGHYRIVQEIGHGAMGRVWLAHDDVIKRNVAIKELLFPQGIGEEEKREAIERFEREAQAAGSLSHPNIVTIFNVEEAEGIPFIVMEYLEGATLAQVIQEGPMTVPRTTGILAQLCDALSYAHAHQVVHRDIKPENIFLLFDGRLKVTDFGIARVLGTSTVTQIGTVMGTPGYMSPEQVKGERVDWRTDIFSTGVLLYEMLTGLNPFEADTPTSVMYKVVHEEPPPLSAINPDLPPHLQAVITRACAKDREARYQDALELKRDLEEKKAPAAPPEPREAAVLRAPVEAVIPPPPPVPVPPAPSKRRYSARAIFSIIAVAALLFAGVLIAIILATSSSSSETSEVAVPDLIGISWDEARSQVESAGLDIEKSEVSSDAYPEGEVISQAPAAGEKVEKGSVVNVDVAMSTSDDTEDDGDSTSGGNTDFSLDMQEIGKGDLVSDLKVADIKWSDQGEYFRIVFEFEREDGGEVTEVPNCNTWYTASGSPGHEKYYELFIALDDILPYQFDYAPFSVADKPVSLGDSLVETMERVSSADTEPVFFLIRCSYSEAHPGVSSRPHRLMYESDPMRVILDIQKM